LRPRADEARAGRLEGEDQVRRDPGGGSAAAARRDPSLAARALRGVGLRARAGGAGGHAQPVTPPKVSVVVPVYNPGHDIDDCIRTILDQSLPAGEYEAIFVDDGSTDATPAPLAPPGAGPPPRRR